MTAPKLALLVVLAIAIGSLIWFGLHDYLTLETIQNQRLVILDFYHQNQLLTVIAFFAFYVVYTGLSLPGAAPLTLLAGALMGFGLGVFVVSFASTLGATSACLLSRYLFRDVVQRRLSTTLDKVNNGIQEDGTFYLFALRLVPVFPFFAVNLVMGLTRMRIWTFWWVSQLGMLAGTAVFVNAGRELGKINQLSDVLSPTLIVSFTILGLLPVVAKKVVEIVRERHRRGQ